MLTLQRTSFDLDLDSIDPHLPWLKSKSERKLSWRKLKERRSENNARERTRIRNMNQAINRLGDICNKYWKTTVPLTKLGILQATIKLIKTLEEQLKKRDEINPGERYIQNLSEIVNSPIYSD